MSNFVIAIDGPAGAGKSTVAKLVARKLGFLYVDTGAMYRALTFKAMLTGIALDDAPSIISMAKKTQISLVQNKEEYHVILDGNDVSEEIRSESVSKNSHFIASILQVRQILWEMQREFRKRHNLVMEGRDIGSVVFPDAQLKIFLDASVEERARRRYLQLKEKQMAQDIEEIKRDIIERDRRDSSRTVAPLVRPPDAIYVDSTGMKIEDEVSLIVSLYLKRAQRMKSDNERCQIESCDS